MRWYIKKNSETPEEILIDYSHEANDTCDGLISFNKVSHHFEIRRLSDGSDEFITEWLYRHAIGYIEDGTLGEKKRIVAIG